MLICSFLLISTVNAQSSENPEKRLTWQERLVKNGFERVDGSQVVTLGDITFAIEAGDSLFYSDAFNLKKDIHIIGQVAFKDIAKAAKRKEFVGGVILPDERNSNAYSSPVFIGFVETGHVSSEIIDDVIRAGQVEYPFHFSTKNSMPGRVKSVFTKQVGVASISRFYETDHSFHFTLTHQSSNSDQIWLIPCEVKFGARGVGFICTQIQVPRSEAQDMLVRVPMSFRFLEGRRYNDEYIPEEPEEPEDSTWSIVLNLICIIILILIKAPGLYGLFLNWTENEDGRFSSEADDWADADD